MLENKKIRILIVDDEPLGRKMVRGMLKDRKDVEIIGECENGTEAVTQIKSANPDLVFLDVQMPETSGFDVLEQIAGEKQPAVVFVTAYNEYAIRAFEVNAADYLLKPYDRERFEQAFLRAAQQIRSRSSEEINEQLLAFLSANRPSEQFIERFIIKNGGRVFFLKTDEIYWIEAEQNYVMLHTRREKHLFREAISRLEQTLNPQKFQRISRSVIVNLDYVEELQPFFRGNYLVILEDGTELKLSHRYRQNLNKYLAGSL